MTETMPDMRILKQSFAYAGGAIFYIVAVATFMQNLQRIFGPGPDGNDPYAPVVFLLVLVVSAATMGLLVFGKPVMLYIDGKKREAVTMAFSTVGILAAFTFLLIVAMAVSRS